VYRSVVIAIGFYGNETANKGLERSVNAGADIVDTVALIRNQVTSSTCLFTSHGANLSMAIPCRVSANLTPILALTLILTLY